MENKKVARYLTAAGIVAAVGGAAAVCITVPGTALLLGEEAPQQMRYFWLVFAYALALVALCVLALREYFLICRRIGQNNSFCAENARGLNRIGLYLLTGSGLCLTAFGALLLPEVSAGLWCIELVVLAVAGAAMGVLAWALGKLLDRAVRLQEENELTI